MALPLLFIGIAAATGGLGIGKGVKAGIDNARADSINKEATASVQDATDLLNRQREACGKALRVLGEEKMFVLNASIDSFLKAFTQIKNVDFTDSQGLEELRKFHIDEREFTELKSMVDFAANIAGGVIGGAGAGALVAFGAYGAAHALAAASTGTAIAALHGVAATNATLAFFGGGSLAAGGLGMAGGAAVLGGLVAGPALMVLGFVADSAASKKLEQALTNQAEAVRMTEELNTASLQCDAIRRRTYMFYNLLARLDARFLPMIYKMEDIIKTEGYDYRSYCPDSKKAIAACASIAVTIKSVLDTPLLTDDGLLTGESESTISLVQGKLAQADKSLR